MAAVAAVADMRVAEDVEVVAEAVAGVTGVVEAGGTRVGSQNGNRAVGVIPTARFFLRSWFAISVQPANRLSFPDASPRHRPGPSHQG